MTILLPNSVRRARKRLRTLRPVMPARADAVNYFGKLLNLNQGLINTSDMLQSMIEQGISASQIADTLERAHTEQIQKYLKSSVLISKVFVDNLKGSNKRKVERTIASAFGLNKPKVHRTQNAKSDEFKFEQVASITSIPETPIGSLNSVVILDDPAISGIVQAAIIDSTQLIRSIAPQYFSLVSQAISANFRGEPQVGGITLVQRLQDIGGITTRRARFIARDQTAKVTSSLTRARHEAVGINSYKWSNSRDSRVVGNPAGLYPKGSRGHGNHWDREGVKFSYSKPPHDGNPGQAYNCRCTAMAVLDLDDLDAVYS